jgi:hypothetical protein
MVWEVDGKSGRIPFRNIRRLRMSFKPVSMQAQRFITEIWSEDAPKFEIVSSSWKSLVEQERQDKSYSTFIVELHRRIACAGVPVRFEQGGNPVTYWPALIVFAAGGLGMALLTVRALQMDAMGGAVFIAAFLVLFLWQGGLFFRRNRPGVYRPDALPADLLPKG